MAQDGSDKNELSPQKRRLLEALLLGKSVQDAAEDVPTSMRTAYRWLAEPEFKAELKRLQSESLERVLRCLSAIGTRAAATLSRNMGDDRPASVQVRAATAVLQQLVAISQFHDLEERLAALEAQLGAQNGSIK